MSKLKLIVGFVVGWTCLGPICSATMVYDNGGSNQQDGGNLSGLISTDDFALSSASKLLGITFTASANKDPFIGQFSGTIGWAVFSNNGSQPGGMLASGSDSSPVLTDTGDQIFGTEEYQISVALPQVFLAPGTYWLGLHEGAIGTPDDGSTIYWDTTGSQTNSFAMVTDDLTGSGGWRDAFPSQESDLAFTLTFDTANSSAPEPRQSICVALLVMGLFIWSRKLSSSGCKAGENTSS